MSRQAVELKVVEGLARVVLSRPEVGNPIDGAFCGELRDVANELAGDPGVRAVLLEARGKFFSVGGDLNAFAANLDRLPDRIREWTAAIHLGVARLARLDAPLVAAVHGTVMGGAVALAALCDVVYCARSAKLGSAFTQIGYSCDGGTSAALAARMGPARARRFVLLAEMLTAEQAAAAGLVDFVVDDDKVAAEAEQTALRLARGPTRAYGEVRRLFARSLAQPFEAQLEDEAQALARVAGTEDAREGIRSFVEKRKPAFHGR
jgi:2-(1,2-epoxy-1,2-dihydrophenyl)acetyl-CoA isomerase